ncbi:MAG: M20/M25/M40 family metallo-hydrolase [Candidatus Eisenbacteria bacterium]|nr:M20/M25/M40 family metallo-hydrolase [Candidatus Eisenbacteria bacterium]
MSRLKSITALMTYALVLFAASAADSFPATPQRISTIGTHERSSRDPLAAQLGLVEAGDRPGSAGVAGRGVFAGQLLLRVPPDSLIASLMDSTSLPRMVATVQRLQDFGTRYVARDSCWAAGYWIRDRFEELGLSEVRLDTFRTFTFQDSVAAMNVLAIKEGTTRPCEYVVLGGHYDSVSSDNFDDPFAPAPGAEDNATAVAAVLEAARLLRDLSTDRSIIFACWSAEEEGLWGSRDFVARAIQDSLDIVVYLNMDCIGYLEPEQNTPPVIVFTDSLSLAVAGYMQTLAADHTPYELQTRVQPIGASDHTSFWERGYNVVDTGTTISSPYRHTAEDVLENIDPAFMRAIAAINVAATAAVAGVVGTDPNLPPETYRIANCAATSAVVTMRPTFEWGGVDFDGEVATYEYRLGSKPNARWRRLPPDQTSLTLQSLDEGENYLLIRAVDDDGRVDPTPVRYEFVADASLRPILTVRTNFLPGAVIYGADEGTGCDVDASDRTHTEVYEGERLVFSISSDASSYCGAADSISFAVNDSSSWSDWEPSPYELVLRPEAGDTCVYVRTHDENGAATMGSLSLRTVAAPRDRPLLRVDDWFGWDVSDQDHDAFYDRVLADETCDVWDPYEHIEGAAPTLPSMEELGRYRTVLWSLDCVGGLLRQEQAELAYHYIEGYVRAGGNLILEGQSTIASLSGTDYQHCAVLYEPGCFVYDQLGVDSLRNSGAAESPSNPCQHGYAFLGGLSAGALDLPDAPLDTLDKWADGYIRHGGLPKCEVVRPLPDVRTLYLFDSYLNPELEGLPCATLRSPTDGTGSVAYFGFPLYYIETDSVSELLPALLRAISSWQEAAELTSFAWSALPDSVLLSWTLAPVGDTLACWVERKSGPADAPGDFLPLNSTPLVPTESGSYRYIDCSVDPGRTYTYRLQVVERWGGRTRHGPWEIETPPDAAVSYVSWAVPNPFRDEVVLSYFAAASGPRLTARVFDVSGRLVRTLLDKPAVAGTHDLAWDGTDHSGRPVASGVYFVQLVMDDEHIERKVVRLR